jgi:Cu/Zn superoxide dismutase
MVPGIKPGGHKGPAGVAPTTNEGSSHAKQAIAVFTPAGFNSFARGTILFTQDSADGPVDIWIYADQFQVNSAHALHVMEFGDISTQSGSALGSHLNPYNASHGCLSGNNADSKDTSSRHIGDLGNLFASDIGIIQARTSTYMISLYPDAENSIIGHGISLSANSDSCLAEDEDGVSGSPTAQGVIAIRDPDQPDGFVSIQGDMSNPDDIYKLAPQPTTTTRNYMTLFPPIPTTSSTPFKNKTSSSASSYKNGTSVINYSKPSPHKKVSTSNADRHIPAFFLPLFFIVFFSVV